MAAIDSVTDPDAPPRALALDRGAEAVYAFEDFSFSPGRCLLTYRNRPVEIGSRAIGILATMVERPRELIGKDELLAAVWPSVFVHESNIKVNMSGLRRALRDVSGRDDFIKTIPGRGYIFTSPVIRREAGAPSAAPTLSQPAPPPATKAIFGRADAVDIARRSLSTHRATTIVGAGGVGKTTVARVAAADLSKAFPDGVYFADLSKVHDGSFVPTALAAAIGFVQIGRGVLHEIAASLAARQVLLVLDNCEHVLSATASAVDQLLAGTEHLAVLATSREPLRCKDESILRLEPLPVPSLETCGSLDQALSFASTEMLIARAFPNGAADVDDDDVPAVVRIACRLNGLPLAIELAAAAVAKLGLPTVETMLAQRIDLLHDVTGKAPPRHVTLRAAMEWSYGLLSPTAASVLRAVSVFRGEFELGAAVEVVDCTGLTEIDIANRLQELCAKSLVHQQFEGGAMRYRLLDSTRAFGTNLLDMHGERTRVSSSHANYMLMQLAETEVGLHDGSRSYADLENCVHDIRAALAWALGYEDDPLLAIRLAVAAVPLWIALSLPEECHETSERALARLDALPSPDQRSRARLLLGMAVAKAYLPENPEVCRRTWEMALRAARATDDVELLAQVLSGFARSETLAGRHVDAFTHIKELRAVATMVEDGWASVEGDMLLAMGLVYTAEYARALTLFERLSEQNGRPHGAYRRGVQLVAPRIQLSITHANALWLTGSPGRAVDVTERAARDALQIGHPLARCHALTMGTITIALRNGHFERASRYAAELAEAVVRHGLSGMQSVSRCLSTLAECGLQGATEATDDKAPCEAPCETLAALPITGLRPVFQVMIADALVARGRPGDAVRPLETACDRVYASQRDDWILPELLRVRAAVAFASGDRHSAEALFVQALETADAAGSFSLSLRAALGLARLRQAEGRGHEAASVLFAAVARIKTGAGTRDYDEASALLKRLASPQTSTPV